VVVEVAEFCVVEVRSAVCVDVRRVDHNVRITRQIAKRSSVVCGPIATFGRACTANFFSTSLGQMRQSMVHFRADLGSSPRRHGPRWRSGAVRIHAGHADRRDVLQVLLEEAQMLLGADEKSVAGKVAARSMAMADGSTALIGFTSAPEVVAFNPSDAVVAVTTLEVLEMVRKDNYSGIVINPAGPSIVFVRNELAV
jgi:hypothetical protein